MGYMKEDVRAAVLIEKDGKYLLVQEAAPVIYGSWNWQQGKVDEGEEPKDAAVREAKEETGLDVRLVRKLGVVDNPFPGTKETHIYLGEVMDGSLSFSKKEILDARWYTKAEIMDMKDRLTGSWVIKILSLLE